MDKNYQLPFPIELHLAEKLNVSLMKHVYQLTSDL